MTLTLTAYDASPEVAAFFAQVKAAQGHVTQVRYSRRSPSIADYTAYCPDQPELLPYEPRPIKSH